MEQQTINTEFFIDVKYKMLAYYAYPTGTVGSSYIASTEDKESVIYKLVEGVLDEAVKSLGFRRDNKEAVMCMIEGIEKPVYLVAYDWKRVICYELSATRKGREYLIP